MSPFMGMMSPMMGSPQMGGNGFQMGYPISGQGHQHGMSPMNATQTPTVSNGPSLKPFNRVRLIRASLSTGSHCLRRKPSFRRFGRRAPLSSSFRSYREHSYPSREVLRLHLVPRPYDRRCFPF